MKRIAVIIPNWNGEKILKKCLLTLKKQTFKDFIVIVVDNGSKDNSNKMVEQEFTFVKLIKLKKNTGFAKASNVGIREAFKNKHIKYLCPLNNDIELDKNYLKSLLITVKKLKKQKINFGVIAAKLYFKEDPQIINTVGTIIQRDGSGMERGYKEKEKKQYSKIEEIFGGCGAAVLYSRKMLKQIAYKNSKNENCYFDESFFAYYEDLDLNYRSRLMGFKAFLSPASIGWHMHSATGKSFSKFKSYYVHRNQYFVLLKNFPLPFLILGFILLPFRYFLLVLSTVIKKGPSHELKKKNSGLELFKIVITSWLDVVRNLKQIFKKRKIIQSRRKISHSDFNSWFKKYKARYSKMIFTS